MNNDAIASNIDKHKYIAIKFEEEKKSILRLIISMASYWLPLLIVCGSPVARGSPIICSHRMWRSSRLGMRAIPNWFNSINSDGEKRYLDREWKGQRGLDDDQWAITVSVHKLWKCINPHRLTFFFSVFSYMIAAWMKTTWIITLFHSFSL